MKPIEFKVGMKFNDYGTNYEVLKRNEDLNILHLREHWYASDIDENVEVYHRAKIEKEGNVEYAVSLSNGERMLCSSGADNIFDFYTPKELGYGDKHQNSKKYTTEFSNKKETKSKSKNDDFER